jgi:hypothetical protein
MKLGILFCLPVLVCFVSEGKVHTSAKKSKEMKTFYCEVLRALLTVTHQELLG